MIYSLALTRTNNENAQSVANLVEGVNAILMEVIKFAIWTTPIGWDLKKYPLNIRFRCFNRAFKQ